MTKTRLKLNEDDIKLLGGFKESKRDGKDHIVKIYEKGIIRIEFVYAKRLWELLACNIHLKGVENAELTYEDIIVLDKVLNGQDYH